MRTTGERTPNRAPRARLLALVLVVAALPVLAGAAAPGALRGLMTPAEAPTFAQMRLPERDGHRVPQHAAPGMPLATERLFEAAVPTRPAAPDQAARIKDLPSDEDAGISELPPARGERALPAPTLKPGDPGWVARRLEIPALGIDVAVAVAGNAAEENFPPHGGAYILRSSSQPGRGTNSYMFAHAMPYLFKPLWWAQIGQQVIVTMSDGQQMPYRITAVVRDIPCPDPTKPKPAGLPPVLANATECDVSWTLPTASERLTMQTSQGFNRNYGEMVVIAEPDW